MSTDKPLTTNPSSKDALKWSVIGLLAAIGLVGNYYFIHQPLAVRMTGLTILLMLILFLGYYTTQGKKCWKFFKESYTELKKVVWPSRQEAVRTTFIVLVIISIFAFVIWLIDLLLIWIINFLTGQV